MSEYNSNSGAGVAHDEMIINDDISTITTALVFYLIQHRSQGVRSGQAGGSRGVASLVAGAADPVQGGHRHEGPRPGDRRRPRQPRALRSRTIGVLYAWEGCAPPRAPPLWLGATPPRPHKSRPPPGSLGPFGATWGHLGPLGTTWDHLGPLGDQVRQSGLQAIRIFHQNSHLFFVFGRFLGPVWETNRYPRQPDFAIKWMVIFGRLWFNFGSMLPLNGDI